MSNNLVNFNSLEIRQEYSEEFEPPVCLKVVYKGQLVLFFINGPNIRQDFHIEEGEELFFMIKGEMFLKIIQDKGSRTVNIKEGELFLLPSRVRHSPRRPENSYGFVIERHRVLKNEVDGFMYYEDSDNSGVNTPKYEVYAKVSDLQTQVRDTIQGAMKDIENGLFKKMIESQRSILPKTDSEASLKDPINVEDYLTKLSEYPEGKIYHDIFQNGYQTKVFIISNCDESGEEVNLDTVIWCFKGDILLKLDQEIKLKAMDFYIIKASTKYDLVVPKYSVAIKMTMSASEK